MEEWFDNFESRSRAKEIGKMYRVFSRTKAKGGGYGATFSVLKETGQVEVHEIGGNYPTIDAAKAACAADAAKSPKVAPQPAP